MTTCMGLIPKIFRGEKAKNDLCVLRGFNLVHKYRQPNRMKYVYHDLVHGRFSCNIRYVVESSTCKNKYLSWQQENHLRDWSMSEDWHRNIDTFKPYIE